MTNKCFYHHRFQYLIPSIPKEWIISSQPIVDKTMLWDLKDTQVWWEYHDGILPSMGQESTERLNLCWEARNKDKRFIYVKPNLSQTQSLGFFELAKQNNFELLTSPKWSYYHDVYRHINNVREEVKKFRNTNNFIETTIVFCGSTTGFNGHYDARKYYIDKSREYWGTNFSIHTGLGPKQYVDVLKMAAYAIQPHGGGLRHATYESMALGIPSLIPESSYIDNITRGCNIVFSKFENIVYDINSIEYKELSQKCIDAWETHMTSQSIVDCVLKQIKE